MSTWLVAYCASQSTKASFETGGQGRVELPTFRFQGSDIRHLVSGRSDGCRRMSSSLLYCLGRVRRFKAKPHAVAARALTRRLRLEGWQPSRRTGEDQDAITSVGRTTVRQAISGPLTSVTSGLSRSSADTPPRRSGHVTGSDCTDSQADNAVRFPSPLQGKAQVRTAVPSLGLVGPGRFRRLCNWAEN